MKNRFFLFSRAFVLCLLFSVISGASAEEKTESLHDYAVRTAGRQAYGLYMRDKKAGWMIYESKLETRGSGEAKKEVVATRYEMLMPMKRGNLDISFRMTTSSIYDLNEEGTLLYTEQVTESEGVSTKYSARPTDPAKPGVLTVVLQRNGKEVSRKTATTRDTLLSSQQFDSWLTSKPAKGAKRTFYSFDHESGEDTETENIFQGLQTISWGGVPTEIYTVGYKMKGSNATMEVRANGWPIRGKISGLMDLRAEEESTAKKMTGPAVDMLAASTIHVNKDLGHSRKVQSLRLEINGLGDFKLPESHRQKIVARKGSTVVLDTRRDFALPKTAALSAAQRQKYTGATDKFSNAASIKALSQKILGKESNPLKKAALLQHWVFINLRKSMSNNADNALDVLQARAGDCTEHTILFVALARASGLPAREVNGIMYAGDFPDPIFGWHAWAEIHDGRQWVSVDPTWDEVWVDATHIEFAHGDEDLSYIDVLDSLKLKVATFKVQ